MGRVGFFLHFSAVCFSGPSVTCLETLNVSQRPSVQGPGGKAGVVHIYLKCLAIKQRWYELIGVQVSLFSHTICTPGDSMGSSLTGLTGD